MKKEQKKYFLCVAGIMAASTALTTGVAFADTGITGIDSLLSWFQNFFTNIQSNFTAILSALAIVVLLAMLGMWMITTNDKKTEVYKKKFFTVLIIVIAIAAISGIVAIAQGIGSDINTTVGGA